MATTKKEILGNQVDPVLRLQRLDEERTSLLNDIKKKLLKQFNEAGDTLRVLLDMGQNEVLREPAFHEITNYFVTNSVVAELPKKKDKRSSSDRKPRLDLMIREYLSKEGQKTIADVIKKFSDAGEDKVRSTITKRSGGDRPIFSVSGDKVGAVKK